MAYDINKRATHFGGLMIKAVSDTAASRTLDANKDSGKTFITGVVTTQTYTLPAATGSNAVFKFIVSVTATGDKIIQAGNTTDEFIGTLLGVDTDTSDALTAYPCLPADNFDTITLNGSTTGGVGGDSIIITDIASGIFLVEGLFVASGVIATPLSAA